MRILSLDPGSEKSGWLILEDGKVIDSGVGDNHDVLRWVAAGQGADLLAAEIAESFGQKVWSQVFTATRWAGRFQQAWREPDQVVFVTRSQVKMELLGKRAGADKDIRQALIERVGPPGTKKEPGPTYGVSSHAWAALAVAVVVDKQHFYLGAQLPRRLAEPAF